MSVNGPMSKSLEDITLYSKAVIDAQPWLVDPKCLPIPWRSAERKSKLRIAVLWHDGLVYPTPPVTRALRETVEKLQAAGHEIVRAWDPVHHSKAVELLVSRVHVMELLLLTIMNRPACSSRTVERASGNC